MKSRKVGEYKQGMVLDVLHGGEENDVIYTMTVTSSGHVGGWVQKRSSKGKQFIEKIQGIQVQRRKSALVELVSFQRQAGLLPSIPGSIDGQDELDLTFEGSGPLGVLFMEESEDDENGAVGSIVVESIVVESIAAGVADLKPGMQLQQVNGQSIDGQSYSEVMQSIGKQWQNASNLTLTLRNPPPAAKLDMPPKTMPKPMSKGNAKFQGSRTRRASVTPTSSGGDISPASAIILPASASTRSAGRPNSISGHSNIDGLVGPNKGSRSSTSTGDLGVAAEASYLMVSPQPPLTPPPPTSSPELVAFVGGCGCELCVSLYRTI